MSTLQRKPFHEIENDPKRLKVAPTKPLTRTGITKPTLQPGKVVANTTSTTEKKPTTPVLKKRPDWDLRGRLQDMEQLTSYLKSKVSNSDVSVTKVCEQLEQSQDRVKQLENFRIQLEQNIETKTKESEQYLETKGQLLDKISMTERLYANEILEAKRKYQLDIEDIQFKFDSMKRSHNQLELEFKLASEESTNLKETISCQSMNILTSETQIKTLKTKLDQSQTENEKRDQSIEALEKDLQKYQKEIELLEQKIVDDELMNRKLYLKITELRANLLVYCRVRPVLDGIVQDESVFNSLMSYGEDEREISLHQRQQINGDSISSKVFPFTLDKVFPPTSSQTQVFEEIVPLIESSIEGCKVTILSYGQKSSGKTFTILGSNDQDQLGLLPRTIDLLFSLNQNLKITISNFEISNETVNDLFANYSNNQVTNIEVCGASLSSIELQSPEEIIPILQETSQDQSQCEKIYIIKLFGTKPNGDNVEGMISFIDLPASEKSSQNKSLKCLSDVVMSLANKETNIPYKASKLTQLLQTLFAGQSKALMIANVLPFPDNFDESLSTLRFAAKVSSEFYLVFELS